MLAPHHRRHCLTALDEAKPSFADFSTRLAQFNIHDKGGNKSPLCQQLLMAAPLYDFPCSSTIIASALRTVLKRWAITNTVRPSISRSITFQLKPLYGYQWRSSLVEESTPGVCYGGAGDGRSCCWP